MESKHDTVPARIVSLFVFNSSWGPTEAEEEKKVVFYWPTTTAIDTKMKHIGLVEGSVNFCRIFTDEPGKSVHTHKQRIVFLEVEPSYWLCLTVSLPHCRRPAKEGSADEVTEYFSDDLDDDVLVSVLKKSYSLFCLFHGGMEKALIRSNGERAMLTSWLEDFYSTYLAGFKVDAVDASSEFCGIQYLALESVEFLRVQSLVNQTEEEFDLIQHSLFLQAGQLVWSGLDLSTTRVLMQYMCNTLLPTLPASSRPPTGFFLVGGEDTDTLPLIYVGKETFYLAVFHAINSSFCLLVERIPDRQFFTAFISSVGPKLANLSADLTHSYVNKTSSSSSASNLQDLNTRFIYFNSANMAVKSTLQEEGRENLLRLATDFASDLKKTAKLEGELVAKLANDEWIVVQIAGPRTIVIYLQAKHLNLMEVSDRVSKLKNSCFDSICML